MKYMDSISLLFFCIVCYGQFTCGTAASNANSQTNDSSNQDCEWCADIPGMIENCDEIWINVTMHFISNDDCTGDVQWQWEGSEGNESYIKPEEAIERAKNMFDNANAILEGMDESINWGMDCWDTYGGDTYEEPVCMPLRFRLAGIEFHCSDELSNSSEELFLSNNDDHIHVTFSEHPSANGEASGSNKVLIEKFSGDLLTHEILHLFGLHHTSAGYANDCDDLPIFPEDMTWFNPFTNQMENIEICYSDEPVYFDDENGVYFDLCDATIFNHNIHPCCDACNISNNTMSYSAFNNMPGAATLSPCQINTALTSLCENNCDVIHTVIPQDGCPPASAVVFQPPGLLYELGDCEICFVLSELYYQVHSLQVLREHSLHFIFVKF